MPSENGDIPNILAFDTALPHISAALLAGERLVERTEEMGRGQAERLMPLLEEVLAEAGRTWRDLDLIAVGIGPGNFTGIRISVAAARGLALGLGIPALGVSMFEVLLDPVAPLSRPAELLSLEAPRGQAYVQPFRFGAAVAPPRLIDPSQLPEGLETEGQIVRGFRADEIARALDAPHETFGPSRVATRMAAIARLRWQAGTLDPAGRPAPLYVRPADAAPPRDPAPVILE